ncbi:MAG: non-ribosomal peptide synthetase, partial [Nitrococcus mobilis]|nr:non-ribosomal peptide synthetase [Nitrococcus mobilis]
MELDGQSVARRFALLTPEKRADFVKALAERGISFARLPIVRADRHAPIPLSYAQQRLWFLMQLDPSSAAYNMPAALRLRGELDIEALRRSFEHVISRHEALRTTFRQSEGGEAEQVIHVPAPLVLAQMDLSELPESARKERVQALAEQEAVGAFDLERGPLLRVRLLRLAADDHVLLVTLHHIVCD